MTASSSQAAATTVGGGGLDSTSAAWFTTFCTGLAPVKDLTAGASSGSTTSAKTAAALLEKLGGAFTDTAAKLKTQSAPTFSGGQDFATKVEAGLAQVGPQLTSAAKKVAAGDTSGLSSLSSLTTSGPFADLKNLKVAPDTEAAIEKIPACKAIGFSN